MHSNPVAASKLPSRTVPHKERMLWCPLTLVRKDTRAFTMVLKPQLYSKHFG